MSKPRHTALSKPPRPAAFSFATLAGIVPASTTATTAATASAAPQQQPRPLWTRAADALASGVAHLIGLGRGAAPTPPRANAPRRAAAPVPVPTRTPARPAVPAPTPTPTPARVAAESPAYTAVCAAAYARGMEATRQRWAAIFSHPLALQHPRDAARLAAEEGLSVAQAHAMLSRFPDRVSLSAQRASRNPQIGVGMPASLPRPAAHNSKGTS